MVSCAIWEKHAQVSFSKTLKLHESEGKIGKRHLIAKK